MGDVLCTLQMEADVVYSLVTFSTVYMTETTPDSSSDL